MKKLSQESAEIANFDSLHDKDLENIKRQIALWGEAYGPMIWRYIFDVTFFKLAKHQGYECANNLLTETRKVLKRSMGNHTLSWFHRCKRQAKKAEILQQQEAA